MRHLFQLLASSVVVATGLTLLATVVACSGSSAGDGTSSDGTDNPFAAPAGCLKTQCDVDHDECTTEPTESCDTCMALCSYSYATCNSVCGVACETDPSPTKSCDDTYAACQQSNENTECVETVADDRERDAGTSSTGDDGEDSGADASGHDGGAVDASNSRDAGHYDGGGIDSGHEDAGDGGWDSADEDGGGADSDAY